jgi:probable HAF family extracellular repeat protein
MNAYIANVLRGRLTWPDHNPTPKGFPMFYVIWGINDSGQITGWSETSTIAASGLNAQHAFLYSGEMHDLGTLGGDNSYGGSINVDDRIQSN